MKIGDIVVPVDQIITSRKFQIVREIVEGKTYLLKDLESGWCEVKHSNEFTIANNTNTKLTNQQVVEKVMVDLIASIEKLCGGKLDQRKALPILSVIEEQVELIINNSRVG